VADYMMCGCVRHEDDEWEMCDAHYSHCCMDCEKHISEFNEYYMVHEWIWNSVVINDEVYRYLCIGCLESRLGRQLRPDDFTGYPVNSPEWAKNRSWRQKMRMGYDL
jgi:hypothetical protein